MIPTHEAIQGWMQEAEEKVTVERSPGGSTATVKVSGVDVATFYTFGGIVNVKRDFPDVILDRDEQAENYAAHLRDAFVAVRAAQAAAASRQP